MTLPILVDCDGVLSNFTEACLALARDQGIYVLESDVTSWDTAAAIGWPRLNEAVTQAVLHKDLCYRLGEYLGAIAWLRDLEATFGKARVYVCTSPWNAEWCSQRTAWLERRGVPIARQIQCKAKNLIPGFLVDDSYHNCEIRPNGQAFLMKRPWNDVVSIEMPRGDYAAAVAWLKEVAL